MAPYCFILADTPIETLFIMFSIVINEMMARKPYAAILNTQYEPWTVSSSALRSIITYPSDSA